MTNDPVTAVRLVYGGCLLFWGFVYLGIKFYLTGGWA